MTSHVAPPAVVSPGTTVAPAGHAFVTCTVLEGEEIEPFLKRELTPHFQGLGIAYAIALVSILCGFIWMSCAIFGMVIVGLGAAYLGVLWFWLAMFVRSVGGRSYAVQSSGGKIRSATHGPGLHKVGIGNRMAQIETNPLPITIEVEQQLTTHEVVKVTFQVTVCPDPRIADSDGLNVYGNWVIEGAKRRQRNFAAHHVEVGIRGPIKGLLTSMLAKMSRKDLDENRHALALFVESELSLHIPLHKDAAFRRRVEGVAAGQSLVEILPGNVLVWYGKHAVAVRAALDQMNVLFNQGGISETALSHHELHIGCTFDNCELIGVVYDPKSIEYAQKVLKSQQDAKAAEQTAPGVTAMTESAVKLGVTANLAYAGALAQAGIKVADLKVVVADDGSVSAAARLAAGLTAGGLSVPTGGSTT